MTTPAWRGRYQKCAHRLGRRRIGVVISRRPPERVAAVGAPVPLWEGRDDGALPIVEDVAFSTSAPRKQRRA